MTSIARVIPSVSNVKSRRLAETAVTPSDCWIENATICEYEESFPTSVMSVPCSVVTTFGALPPSVCASTCRERNAAVACGTA